MPHPARERGWPGWQRAAAVRAPVAAVLLLPVSGMHESVQLLVFLAVLAGGLCVGWSLAERWLAGSPRGERAFAAAVLGIAACVVIGVAIGHFGLLAGWWFRGTLAAAVAASTFLSPRRVSRDGGQREHGAGSPIELRRALRLRGPLRLRRVQRALLWACVLLVGVVYVRTAIRHRHAPPGHFSFDDTSYHLTTVATWAMHEDLRMPRFTYGDPRTTFYPFASELLAWELTTPFGGGDFAARWVELPFAVLTLFGLGLVARRLGAGDAALLAPLLYASVAEMYPIISFTAGNDHALALASVAAVHGALLLWRRPSAGVGAYAGCGLGLLLATKYLGVLYAPLLAGLVALAVAVPARRALPWRARAAALLAAGGAAAVVGGYAYLRNAVTTGNPIFPVQLRIGAWTLPGWADVAPEKWAAAAAGFDAWRFLWGNDELFGPAFRATMLPAAVLAPLAALWLAPVRRRALYAWLLLIPSGSLVLFVRLVEDHRGVRYLCPGLAVAAVAAAWLVSRLPARPRVVVAAGLGGLALWPWVAPRPNVLWLLPIVLAVGWWLARRRLATAPSSRRGALAGASIAAACLVLAASVPGTVRRYERGRYRDQRSAAELERLAGPGGARVAYAGWNQPYLFFGRRMTNRLFMPPAAPSLEAMFYRWRGPVEEGDAQRPRRDWLRNVERLGIQWVVWEMAGRGVRPERGWMARSPRFTCVYTDGAVEIWRVKR